MSDIYNKMIKMIHEDMELATDDEMSVISEDNNRITIWDYYNDDIDRTYTLTDPDIIDKDYVKDRIIITKSADDLIDIDKDMISEYLCEYAKNTLINLEEIIFINDYDKDFEELYKRKDGYNWQEILEVNDLPTDNELGIMWFERSMVVVNIGEILKNAEEMAKSGDIYPEDIPKETGIGIITTLLHELRHIEQANPYMPAIEFDQISMDPEADAEEYARNCYDMHPIDIMNDKDYENDLDLYV